MSGDHRNRKRLAIGEIVGSPTRWPDSYWYVESHASDYVRPKGSLDSREILVHVPTGIKAPCRTNTIRNGNLPLLNIASEQSKTRIIYNSVNQHWGHIFNKRVVSCKRQYRNYRGLPFQREWDPLRGGSWHRAAWEILRDIGPRPSTNYVLSIITHSKGFVRGNLKWETKTLNWLEAGIRKAVRSGSTQEELFKMIQEIYLDRSPLP